MRVPLSEREPFVVSEGMKHHRTRPFLIALLVLIAPALGGRSLARAEWYDHIPGTAVVELGAAATSGEVTCDHVSIAAYDALTFVPLVGPTFRVARAGLWLALGPPMIRKVAVWILTSRVGMHLIVKPQVAAAVVRRVAWESGRWIVSHVDDAGVWIGGQAIECADLAVAAGGAVGRAASYSYSAVGDGLGAARDFLFE